MSVNVVLQTNFEAGNSTLCISLPFGCIGKAFKGGDVGVNVTVFYFEFHELFIGTLGAHGVFPCSFECYLKLVSQDFVGFCNGVCGVGGFCLEGGLLSVDPCINIRAMHI